MLEDESNYKLVYYYGNKWDTVSKTEKWENLSNKKNEIHSFLLYMKRHGKYEFIYDICVKDNLYSFFRR